MSKISPMQAQALGLKTDTAKSNLAKPAAKAAAKPASVRVKIRALAKLKAAATK